MSDWNEPADFADGEAEAEDVEILEVVGVDREAAPPGADDGPDQEGTPEAAPVADGTTAAGFADPAAPAPVAPVEDDPLLRLRADYDNLRKRIDRERQEFELHANSQLTARLLPILDNFERALATGPSDSDRALREGCTMIYKQLTDELRRQGLRPIEATGQPFDPEIHDAVATDAASSEPSNTVVEELRRGYLFRNRLLRPALVKVSTNGDGDGDAGSPTDDSR